MWGLAYFCGLWFSGLIFRDFTGSFSLLLPLVPTGATWGWGRRSPGLVAWASNWGGGSPQTVGTNCMFQVGPLFVVGSLLPLPPSVSGFGWGPSGSWGRIALPLVLLVSRAPWWTPSLVLLGLPGVFSRRGMCLPVLSPVAGLGVWVHQTWIAFFWGWEVTRWPVVTLFLQSCSP